MPCAVNCRNRQSKNPSFESHHAHQHLLHPCFLQSVTAHRQWLCCVLPLFRVFSRSVCCFQCCRGTLQWRWRLTSMPRRRTWCSIRSTSRNTTTSGQPGLTSSAQQTERLSTWYDLAWSITSSLKQNNACRGLLFNPIERKTQNKRFLLDSSWEWFTHTRTHKSALIVLEEGRVVWQSGS